MTMRKTFTPAKARGYCITSILTTCLTLGILTTGCQKKEQASACDCVLLRSGLQAQDHSIVAQEINSLAADLAPSPTTADQIGQQDNLHVLAGRLSSQCGFGASVLHYNGIETYPPQSEIRITDGPSFSRVLDIGYNDQYRLVFHGMHE